jgi:hypothetical protein
VVRSDFQTLRDRLLPFCATLRRGRRPIVRSNRPRSKPRQSVSGRRNTCASRCVAWIQFVSSLNGSPMSKCHLPTRTHAPWSPKPTAPAWWVYKRAERGRHKASPNRGSRSSQHRQRTSSAWPPLRRRRWATASSGTRSLTGCPYSRASERFHTTSPESGTKCLPGRDAASG